MKRILILLGLVLILFGNNAYSRENIREVFKNNKAVIYTINIRNFGAVDKNNDGVITSVDVKGTFLNAKDKLKDLKRDGINTIYLLPITPSGKIKALGTAGSLYAMNSFNEIDEHLDDENNSLTVYEEAKEFINQAHNLDLNVIVDLASCGAYDLSLKKPDWFILDKNNETYTPADWTDVRLFKIYDENKKLYEPNINNFKSFIDMALDLGFDGIRADVASIKPYEFWKIIIDYARCKNENFLFLAEASPDWTNPAPNAVEHYTSIDELLDAGFDCYYGSFSDFKSLKYKKDFDSRIEKNMKILEKHQGKSIISALATHDQQAPSLRSINYWNMVLWLSTTLPLNTYFLDGFPTGDKFTYPYENKRAIRTYTDDEYYFVHSGMFDIFNYNASPAGNFPKLKRNYLKAIDFKERNIDLINNGKFKLLPVDNERVFAYSITDDDRELIVIGSLDDENNQIANIKSKYLKQEYLFTLLNAKAHPLINDVDNIKVNLEPLEIQVYLISLAKTKAM